MRKDLTFLEIYSQKSEIFLPARSDQVRTNNIKSKWTWYQIRSGPIGSDQFRSDHIRSVEIWSQIRIWPQIRSNWIRSDKKGSDPLKSSDFWYHYSTTCEAWDLTSVASLFICFVAARPRLWRHLISAADWLQTSQFSSAQPPQFKIKIWEKSDHKDPN